MNLRDVVKNYVKQKTLCNSDDFYSFEIDADRIAAGHGFEDEREGIPFGTVLLKKALVEAKIWQLMEVVNRQNEFQINRCSSSSSWATPVKV